MRVALKQSWEPILASGGTVVLGVLCLLFSDLGSNRGLGPISAICIAFAMLAALTFLPALLVLLGRAAFWPFRPTYGEEHVHGRGWERISTSVGRRPGRYLLGSAGALVVLALFLPTFDTSGIPLSEARARRLGVRGGPGGAGPALRGRRGQPRGDHHPGRRLAGRRRRRGRHRRRRRGGALHRRAHPGEPVEVDGLVRLDATLDRRPRQRGRRRAPSPTCGRRCARSTPTPWSAARRRRTWTRRRPPPATCW